MKKILLASVLILTSCAKEVDLGIDNIRRPSNSEIYTDRLYREVRSTYPSLSESGCIGLSFEACFRLMQIRYVVDWRALHEMQTRRARETPIVPIQPRNELFVFGVRTPRAFTWGYPGDGRARTRDGVHEIWVSAPPGQPIENISLEMDDWIYSTTGGNTVERYDRFHIWPLFNDLIPTECRFSSKEEFYRFIVELGNNSQISSGTSGSRFQSIADHVSRRSSTRRCGRIISLMQDNVNGLDVSIGRFGSSKTTLSLSRITSSNATRNSNQR